MFPRTWRTCHEDDLIATLLDASEPGRTRVSVGQAANLLRSGVAVRIRSTRMRVVASLGAGGQWWFLAASVATAVAVVVVRVWVTEVSVEFLVTSLVVVVVPGTGVVYTVSSALGGGTRRGLVAAMGCTLGTVPHLAAAMVGLSGVMQAGATAFEVVRWIGVAYLAFMGISMIREGGGLRLDDVEPVDQPVGTVVRRAVLLNLLNPKLTVFFFAFLPQFLATPPGLADPRLIGLGSIFMLMTFAVFIAYAHVSAVVRSRVLGAPTVMRWVQRSVGGLLVGFAARLAITDR
ncbi:MAG TPA: LysE family translocator [Ilumatobacteraceae bacterium]|nr:LysE family translocator [Ilumatobacteraceae bacterium]